jgi:hypothetical protein
MRLCLFCDNNASTKEDAWPLWLMKQFSMPSTGRMFAERGSELKHWAVTKPKLIVKWLCGSCNNGWMSQLENEAKPIIESILEDNTNGFDAAAQETLGVWAVKTAMVLEAVNPEWPRFYSVEERHRLRTARLLPARTEVWLAKCVNQPDIYSAAVDHRTGSGDDGARAFAVTMAFGSLAFQVVTLRTPASVPEHVSATYDSSDGPWNQVLLQVWPTSSEKRVWPPKMGLDSESGVNALAERLSYTKR